MESARRDGDPFYAAYVLVLALGLRKGEVLGLQDDDVDLDDAEQLAIRSQLQRVGRRLLHRDTKTDISDACLPLPGIATTALRLRLAAKHDAEANAGTTWQGSTLVFCTRYGTPIEPRNFNRSWHNRCAKAGSETSPCMTPGGPAGPCWRIWTCILGWRWRFCDTPRYR